jgi:hypothetical protein
MTNAQAISKAQGKVKSITSSAKKQRKINP